MDKATDNMGAAAETGHGRGRVGEWARPPTPNCTAADANEPTGVVTNNERSGQRRDEARTPTRRRMGAAADAEKHGRRRKGEWGAKTMRGADANDGRGRQRREEVRTPTRRRMGTAARRRRPFLNWRSSLIRDGGQFIGGRGVLALAACRRVEVRINQTSYMAGGAFDGLLFSPDGNGFKEGRSHSVAADPTRNDIKSIFVSFSSWRHDYCL